MGVRGGISKFYATQRSEAGTDRLRQVGWGIGSAKVLARFLPSRIMRRELALSTLVVRLTAHFIIWSSVRHVTPNLVVFPRTL